MLTQRRAQLTFKLVRPTLSAFRCYTRMDWGQLTDLYSVERVAIEAPVDTFARWPLNCNQSVVLVIKATDKQQNDESSRPQLAEKFRLARHSLRCF